MQCTHNHTNRQLATLTCYPYNVKFYHTIRKGRPFYNEQINPRIPSGMQSVVSILSQYVAMYRLCMYIEQVCWSRQWSLQDFLSLLHPWLVSEASLQYEAHPNEVTDSTIHNRCQKASYEESNSKRVEHNLQWKYTNHEDIISKLVYRYWCYLYG